VKTKHKVIAASVGCGILAWVLEGILDYFFFYEGTLVGLLLTDVPSHEIYIRGVVSIGFVVFGLLVSSVVARRERAEERVVHLNRVLRAIRNVNQLIVREKDLNHLLQGACDNLTETRGYHNAWIAVFDRSGELAAAAESGLDEDFLPLLEQLERHVLPPCGQRAMTEAHVVVIQDPLSICADCPPAAQQEGQGAMVVRLEHEGTVFGLLAVSLPSHLLEDKEERSLLGEVADDIAFALHNLEAEGALARERAELRATLYGIGDAVIATDAMGRVARMNPVAEQLTGWDEAAAGGRPLDEVFQVISEETRQPVENPVVHVMREGKVVGLANHTLLVSKDGDETPIADSGAPIVDQRGEIAGVVLVFRDQTEERLNQRLTEMRLSLIEHAASHTLSELLTRALDEVGTFVESPIGFYHFVEPDQRTLSLQQWSSRTREEFRQATGQGLHTPFDEAGVWVDCVYEQSPVIHNDYASLPYRKGMPEGHAELVRELVVPVMREGQVVAILGVGNKPTEYTGKDVEVVSYLADVTWEIVRQKRAQEAARREGERAQRYLDIAEVLFVALDASGEVTLVNQKTSEVLGYEQEEIIGANWFDRFVPTRLRGEVSTVYRQLMAGEIEPVEYFENPVLTRDGGERIIAWHNTNLEDEEGGAIGVLSSGEDITERKRAEEQLRQALAEKEILLQELYHRTNNNMQVISALIDFQADYIEDERALSAFADTKSRIQSMALVHQHLYQSQDLSRINLRDYIRALTELLMTSHGVSSQRLSTVFDMEDVFVLIDSAIPCGLILNELISNALKHAFPDNRVGEIEIQLRRAQDETIELQVADNGIGVPPDFDFEHDGRLGLENVFALGQAQLQGEVRFEVEQGVVCQLRFKDDLYTPRV
jgi:PAS domain S-box-containing protein